MLSRTFGHFAAILMIAFAFVSNAYAAPIDSAKASDMAYEDEFYAELEKAADQYFLDFRSNFQQSSQIIIQQSAFNQIKRMSILRIRQLAQMKTWLKKSGTGPLRTMAIVEAATNIASIPFMAYPPTAAIGATLLAVPFGPIVGGIQAGWNLSINKIRLLRSLKTVSLAELNAARHSVLGYDLNQKIMTIVFKVASDGSTRAIPLDVVRGSSGQIFDATNPVLTLNEVKVLVETHSMEAKRDVDSIYVDAANPTVYLTKLIYRICLEQDLFQRFVSLVASRASKIADNNTRAEIKQYILRYDTFVRSLEFEDVVGKLEALEKEGKFEKKAMDKNLYKRIKGELKSQADEYAKLRFDVEVAQYHFIKAILPTLKDGTYNVSESMFLAQQKIQEGFIKRRAEARERRERLSQLLYDISDNRLSGRTLFKTKGLDSCSRLFLFVPTH